MAKPSLSDKLGFLPGVLLDAEFQKNGILFGDEPAVVRGCQWVVLDPNRFTMKVWEKSYPTQDVISAAQTLKAAVFSNGPYFLYTPGRADSLPTHILRGYYNENRLIAKDASALLDAVGGGGVRSTLAANAAAGAATVFNLSRDGWTWTAKKLFGTKEDVERAESPSSRQAWAGGGPVGYVIGNAGTIQIRRSATNLAYFGRKSGTAFADYVIGMGDPVGLTEAIGALQLAIRDFQATDVERATTSNQWFFWGLAPLSSSRAKIKPADLTAALAAYSKAAGAKTVDGLIVGLYYHSNTHIDLLLDIGVRDAARLDGSDSVIFGRDQTILVGDSMSASKRIAQGWGFAFYPA